MQVRDLLSEAASEALCGSWLHGVVWVVWSVAYVAFVLPRGLYRLLCYLWRAWLAGCAGWLTSFAIRVLLCSTWLPL